MDPKMTAIHQLVADRLIDVLSQPEAVTPGWIQAACRFLRENGVEALATEGSTMEAVQRELREAVPELFNA